uniref:RING-type domain-containing protein n=1 Tax=Chromera velia CCMP2878 TaxID=1169474 RepID=A0A0G4GGG9_9ALVE|eukprot:Cvel_21790.t1-p1 / transcript=Cvel_21790.t1 / gene=Cvel_21790 / organism=Chromera_velia_CCMP2878 / gene_product=TNF receptor-associated factor family protein, putative / transcript_product=TNF receptor-associated factor family protein, putative / location=Cvel_scaffold2076:310-1113(-) / protein_length=268 / sequence_SO=supercontig / SO=protein_coding / is_pseudo=false
MSASAGIRRLGLDSSFAAEGFEELAETALCPVCTDYLEDIVEADCPSRHVFCRPCLQEVQDRQQPCPNCRGNFSKIETAHIHIRGLIEQVKWKCVHFKNGCGFTGTKKQLEKHLDEECDEEEVECKHEGCRKRDRRILILQHQSECGFSVCAFCKEKIPSRDMLAHAGVCQKIPVRCPRRCEKAVRRCEVPRHMETECSEQVIVCEVPGCGAQVKRRLMEQHEDANQKKHIKLLTAQLVATSKMVHSRDTGLSVSDPRISPSSAFLCA